MDTTTVNLANVAKPAPLHSDISAALQQHYQALSSVHMRELFAADPQRFERFSLQVGAIFLDYSKNRITAETLQLLTQLADVADVAGWRDRLFNGEKINNTEDRAVLHTALRNQSNTRPCWSMALMSCLPSTPSLRKWAHLLNGYAAAHGQATPANRSWMWSMSASVAQI